MDSSRHTTNGLCSVVNVALSHSVKKSDLWHARLGSNTDKFEPRTYKAVFLGHVATQKSYKVYNLATQSCQVARDMVQTEVSKPDSIVIVPIISGEVNTQNIRHGSRQRSGSIWLQDYVSQVMVNDTSTKISITSHG
ncbi:hypothetical protein LIER_10005 [Lithospermum erythrorhizon]|uniref:Retroviral polymerase SH3-like domain-containing protein n=1 Tax=Lithospermum erythrorhizon TaxID=34254 RepID=A0AAV3PJ14_LITER